jgi:hypothetical protein
MNQQAKLSGVNYDCAVCKQTKRLPNLLGKFVIINTTEYQCNSCETIYKRDFCIVCQKIKKIPATSTYYTEIHNNCCC